MKTSLLVPFLLASTATAATTSDWMRPRQLETDEYYMTTYTHSFPADGKPEGLITGETQVVKVGDSFGNFRFKHVRDNLAFFEYLPQEGEFCNHRHFPDLNGVLEIGCQVYSVECAEVAGCDGKDHCDNFERHSVALYRSDPYPTSSGLTPEKCGEIVLYYPFETCLNETLSEQQADDCVACANALWNQFDGEDGSDEDFDDCIQYDTVCKDFSNQCSSVCGECTDSIRDYFACEPKGLGCDSSCGQTPLPTCTPSDEREEWLVVLKIQTFFGYGYATWLYKAVLNEQADIRDGHAFAVETVNGRTAQISLSSYALGWLPENACFSPVQIVNLELGMGFSETLNFGCPDDQTSLQIAIMDPIDYDIVSSDFHSRYEYRPTSCNNEKEAFESCRSSQLTPNQLGECDQCIQDNAVAEDDEASASCSELDKSCTYVTKSCNCRTCSDEYLAWKQCTSLEYGCGLLECAGRDVTEEQVPDDTTDNGQGSNGETDTTDNGGGSDNGDGGDGNQKEDDGSTQDNQDGTTDGGQGSQQGPESDEGPNGASGAWTGYYEVLVTSALGLLVLSGTV